MKGVYFAAWKRRVEVGTELLCVEQDVQPRLVGATRVVTDIRSNGVFCTAPPISDRFHTRWPKASEVTMLDDDTARWPLFNEPKPTSYITLRIVPKGAK